ncbi:MAG: transglycosylase domain-containing protein [Dehalococcoidia bacterium]
MRRAEHVTLRIIAALTAAAVLLSALSAEAMAYTGWTMYERHTRALPEVSSLLNANYGPAKIYDRNGTLLYEFEDPSQGLYEKVTLATVSPWVLRATIATEDASFYTNPGVNIRGLIRAGLENFFPGQGDGLLQGSGGSSITQQLVKNVLIPEEDRYERNVDRKVKEAILAVELTRRYSKDQLLEWYLDQIYYGNRAYGIGAASQRYFGVPPSALTLSQAALLAGIPQQPIAYDPVLNLNAAKARREQVFELMVRHGYATQAQVDAARAEDLVFTTPTTTNGTIRAPHWVFYVQEQLLLRFGEARVHRGGLRVTTTLDIDLQEKGQAIVDEWVGEFERQNCGCHNGALVAVDNNTGQILAMVGSRDFFRKDIQGENNNATAIKQPGSAFKPAVYLAAFMKGWNPSTIVLDAAKKYPNPGGEPFVPIGPTSRYMGPVTVRQALGSSLNAPAVRAAEYAGVSNVIEVAHRLGISTLNDPGNYGVSIATGGANITLLDMTYMYSTLANNGVLTGQEPVEPQPRRLEPIALLKVTDGQRHVLYEFREPKREQVVPAQHAYLVTDILKDDSARRLIYSPGLFELKNSRPLAAEPAPNRGSR